MSFLRVLRSVYGREKNAQTMIQETINRKVRDHGNGDRIYFGKRLNLIARYVYRT